MEKNQISEFEKAGKIIAENWLAEGVSKDEMDPDYGFAAEGDHSFVMRLAEKFGLDMDEDEVWEEVWSAVKDGYREVCDQ